MSIPRAAGSLTGAAMVAAKSGLAAVCAEVGGRAPASAC
jgi:hypothetical protein